MTFVKVHVLFFFLKNTLKYAVVAACFGNYKLSAQVVEHIWKTLWNYKFRNSWLKIAGA